VHNAYHYALGVSRAATEWVMLALSVLMLGSMHAVQVNHLRHHRYCLGEEDVEAMARACRLGAPCCWDPGFRYVCTTRHSR
jgi:fatty acid desaturase